MIPGAASTKEPLIKSLQVYRGLAALIVVFYHLGLLIEKYFQRAVYTDMWRFGSSGVQFFFVLSGYIIYRAHAGELGRRELLGAYALKRLTRIYPPYWIVTLALAPILFLVPDFGEPYHKSLSALFYSLVLWPQSHPPHLGVGWTLIHEMLFYAVFALLFIDARWIYAFLVWAVSIVVFAALGSSSYYLTNFFFSLYNLLFLLGVVIALLHERVTRPAWLAGGSMVAGLSLYALGGFLIDAKVFGLFQSPHFPRTPGQSTLLFGVASGLLVFGCGIPRLEDRFFSSRFFLFLGAASYSIYLVNYPALSVTAKVFRLLHLPAVLPNFILWLLLAVAAVAIGCAFHVWIETPVLRALKHRLQQKRTQNPPAPYPVVAGSVSSARTRRDLPASL